MSEIQQWLRLDPYETGDLVRGHLRRSFHLRSWHVVNGVCRNPARMQSPDVAASCPVFVIRNFMHTLQRTGGVCFAGLENTLRGDIRIDNHMKVGGSNWLY